MNTDLVMSDLAQALPGILKDNTQFRHKYLSLKLIRYRVIVTSISIYWKAVFKKAPSDLLVPKI